MAFRILSEEEKLFMTKEQLEVYERELRLYKERLAFIEKVEQIERADIKKFIPSLRPVSVISSPRLVPFENKGTGRIELKKTAVKMPDMSVYAARKISENDITGFMDAAASAKARAGISRELMGSISRRAASAAAPLTNKISISKTAVPSFRHRGFESPAADMRVQLMKKPTAEFDIRSFSAPERKAPRLRKPGIATITAGQFAKPEFSAVKLDTPAKAAAFSAVFTAPERQEVKLNVPSKAAVPSAEFRLAALSAPKVERRPVRKYEAKHFAMPSLSRPQLKAVSAAVPKLRSFEAQQVKAEVKRPETMPALKLADFRKPEVSAKISRKDVPEIKHTEFGMPEIKAPKLSKPDRPEVKAGSFNAPEMPEIRLSVNVSPVKPQFSVKPIPEVRAEIRKPEIIACKPDLSRLNFMAGHEKKDVSVLEKAIISKTEKIRSLNTDSLRDNILSAFKNDIKGTEV
ncbi:hypothetical protein [Ruminococcus sp.]|uniref:hypothetical protein n=1 Tax=Ruminococcus sp. TaxID=41978 RepID=UPI002BBC42EC|nr:hypothetical protein [Ruminococcus sp.]HNZ99224.1 hypothetical protein [Ruminococcus sp.]